MCLFLCRFCSGRRGNCTGSGCFPRIHPSLPSILAPPPSTQLLAQLLTTSSSLSRHHAHTGSHTPAPLVSLLSFFIISILPLPLSATSSTSSLAAPHHILLLLLSSPLLYNGPSIAQAYHQPYSRSSHRLRLTGYLLLGYVPHYWVFQRQTTNYDCQSCPNPNSAV